MGKAEQLAAGATAGGAAIICHATGGKPGRAGSAAGVTTASGAI
jgi:hypothetical protein